MTKDTALFALCLSCPDQAGIVAAVAGCLYDHQCNIEESAQFHNSHSGQFCMRVAFTPLTGSAQEKFLQAFHDIANRFGMTWAIHNLKAKVKTLILASHHDHCLNDLLYRWRTGYLDIDICGIVSNHDTARGLAQSHNIPFTHLPVTAQTKHTQERQIASIIEQTGAELIVLARYMQILSPDFSNQYHGRIINIHHSFLPGFKGARPYHQAYERGVKIIGATAHFVTDDLDEGPIIAQDVMPVSHTDNASDMQEIGQDIETRVLSRAVKLYTERRIFLHDNRTILL